MPGVVAEAGQLEALDQAVVDWLTISCTMVPGQTYPRQVLNLGAIKRYSDHMQTDLFSSIRPLQLSRVSGWYGNNPSDHFVGRIFHLWINVRTRL
jgi:hypothetical protein